MVFESSSSPTHESTEVRSYACLGPRRICVLHPSSRSVKSLDTRPGTRIRSYRPSGSADLPHRFSDGLLCKSSGRYEDVHVITSIIVSMLFNIDAFPSPALSR
jgi:hypothetical protein